jgi:hypothetical protein
MWRITLKPIGSSFLASKITLPSELTVETAPLEKQFIDLLASYKRIVVLSPHLDDAVLSTGGLLAHLAERNVRVEVINFFTAGSSLLSPLTTRLLEKSKTANAEAYFAARKAEDEAVFQTLHITVKHLNLTDSAWRTTQDGQPLYRSIFDPVSDQDKIIVEKAKLLIRNLIDESTLVIAPLARGRHVDHVLTRETATTLQAPIIFYTDYPYVLNHPNEDAFIANKQLAGLEYHGACTTKKNLIAGYSTQEMSFLDKREVLPLVHEVYYFAANFLNKLS